MQINNINIRYISHCTFILELHGTTLLTDPYFCGSFEWDGNIEKHMQMSSIRPEHIKHCDYIFVSHDHGDHFDINAIRTICGNTNSHVLAAKSICDTLSNNGINDSLLIPATEELLIETSSFSIMPLGNYDNSLDTNGLCNKFSLLINSNNLSIWYCGDNHEMPPNLFKYKPNAVISWTNPHTLERLNQINASLSDFVIMHCDKHEPGKFWCSKDVIEEYRAVKKSFPNTTVHLLDRIESMNVSREG